MHVSALVSSYDGSCGVELWVDSLEAYERVLPHKAAFESRWPQEAGGQVKWDDHDEEKKSRRVVAQTTVGYDEDDWSTIYRWIVSWMLRIRELAMAANGM